MKRVANCTHIDIHRASAIEDQSDVLVDVSDRR